MSQADIGVRVLVEVSETDASGRRRDYHFIGTLEGVQSGRVPKLSFRREDTHELVSLNGRLDGLAINMDARPDAPPFVARWKRYEELDGESEQTVSWPRRRSEG